MERRTLYSIGDDLLALDALIEEVGGDVTDPQVESAVTAWFNELAASESLKLDRYCGYLSQLECERDAAAKESAYWRGKEKTRDNRIAWLKDRLRGYLAMTGRTSVKTETGRVVAVQKNGGKQPLDIDPIDIAAVPERFVVVRREIDESAVRAAVEAGESLPWARLLDRGTHLRVR